VFADVQREDTGLLQVDWLKAVVAVNVSYTTRWWFDNGRGRGVVAVVLLFPFSMCRFQLSV